MASFKSKIVNLLIRKSYLLRGKLSKPVFDMNTSIYDFRDRCEKGAGRFGQLPGGIKVKPEIIDGVNSEWLVPPDAESNKVILYFHGGGYVSGSCNDHRNIISKFAMYAGYTNLIFEYGLAPENPFPASINDFLKVYRYLLSNGYQAGNILFAGESAGGGLCLAALLALKEYKLPYPSAAVAISPWTDLTCSSDSYKTKNKFSPAPIDSWFVFGKHYYGTNDPKNPLISPLFGDLSGLPPVFINSGVSD
jgi:epsilon-lactone hydrolase